MDQICSLPFLLFLKHEIQPQSIVRLRAFFRNVLYTS